MADGLSRDDLTQQLKQEKDLLATLRAADLDHDHKLSGAEVAGLMVQDFGANYQAENAKYKADPRANPDNAPITPDNLRQDIADAQSADAATRQQGARNLQIDLDLPNNTQSLRSELSANQGNLAAFQEALAQHNSKEAKENYAADKEPNHGSDYVMNHLPKNSTDPQVQAGLDALQKLKAVRQPTEAPTANDDLYRQLISIGKEINQYKPENIADPTLQELSQAVASGLDKATGKTR